MADNGTGAAFCAVVDNIIAFKGSKGMMHKQVNLARIEGKAAFVGRTHLDVGRAWPEPLPEPEPPAEVPAADLVAFLRGYMDAVVFTECHNDNPEMRDAEFSPAFERRAEEDCEAFMSQNLPLLAAYYAAGRTPEQAGTDFWFTRNRHGAGYWDRGLPEPVGDALTRAARLMESVEPYAGDDGMIHAN